MQSLQFSKHFPLPKNGGHFEFSNFCQKWQNTILLRKIALPYPHKCLFVFVEQKRIDRQEFFKEYSCHKR